MTHHTKRRMTPTVFGLALSRLGVNGSSYEAARLVMVEGKAVIEAGRTCKVARQSVYEAMDKVQGAIDELGVCYACGHRLQPV